MSDIGFTALSADTVAIVTLELDDDGQLEVTYRELTDVPPPPRWQIVRTLRDLADAFENESELAGD